MTFVHKAPGAPRSLAILAGAFNPPTVAHVALVKSALEVVDEVLLAIPRAFPHKPYHGASLEQRAAMLHCIARAHSNVSVAVAEGGLFAEIAREARPQYTGAEIHLLCGRDAAERILTWEYDEPDFADRMLEEFGLLVAPRFGEYVPPDRYRHAVRSVHPGDYDECSSTRLRDALEAGSDWQSLVPDCIVDVVERIYR